MNNRIRTRDGEIVLTAEEIEELGLEEADETYGPSIEEMEAAGIRGGYHGRN